MKVLSAVAAVLLAIGPASAFEADGFKTGMTVDEVQAVARTGGFVLTNEQTHRWTTFESSQERLRRFAFCRGRLFGYSKPLQDLAAFIRSVTENTKRVGRAEYRASGYEGLQPSSATHTLNMEWRTGDEGMTVQAEQMDWKAYYAIFWASKNECAQPQ